MTASLLSTSSASFIKLKAHDDCINCDLSNDEMKERAWGPKTEVVRLSMHVSNQVYAVGHPVIASVAMRNTTDHSIGYPMSFPIWAFALSVEDERGAEVPLARWMQNVDGQAVPIRDSPHQPHEDMGGIVNADSGVRLDPQKAIKMHFLLDRTFDLTKPGKYFVTVRYRIPKSGVTNEVYVVSNTVTVEVTAASSGEPSGK